MVRPLIFFLILGLVIGACSPKELPTISIADRDSFTVMLSHQSTKQEMDEIAEELETTYGAMVDYAGTQYFEDGRLQSLVVMVTLPSGSYAKGAAELLNIQFKYFGFKASNLAEGKGTLWLGQMDKP